MDGKDEEKPLAVMKSSATKASIRKLYRFNYGFCIFLLILVFVLGIIFVILTKEGFFVLLLFIPLLTIGSMIAGINVIRTSFQEAAEKYNIKFYPDYLIVSMPYVWISLRNIDEIRIQYNNISKIRTAEKAIGGFNRFIALNNMYGSKFHKILCAIPPQNGYWILFKKPQNIPTPMGTQIIKGEQVIIDILDIDTFNKIAFKKETKSKPKGVLIECPKCKEEFRIEKDAKDIVCPHCGVKGTV